MPERRYYPNTPGQSVTLPPLVGAYIWAIHVRCGPVGDCTVTAATGDSAPPFTPVVVGQSGWTVFHGELATGWTAVPMAANPTNGVPDNTTELRQQFRVLLRWLLETFDTLPPSLLTEALQED